MVNQYDEEPVWFCEECLSLQIMTGYVPYCAFCGSTEIGQCDIYEWEEKWEERYGKRFLNT